jgi:hypothetical protein
MTELSFLLIIYWAPLLLCLILRISLKKPYQIKVLSQKPRGFIIIKFTKKILPQVLTDQFFGYLQFLI